MSTTVETDAAEAVRPAAPTGLGKIVERILEATSIAAMLVAVGVACLQVTLRYVFNSGLPWPEELATWMFAWSVFLGMAVATSRDAHISIDVVLRLLGPGPRSALEFFGHAIIAAVSFMLLIHGWDYVSRVISASPALQLPMKYFFLAVPVGGLFNLFFLGWPKPGRSLPTGLGIVLTGLAIYLAVRYGAPRLYDQDTSAVVLVAVGVFSIIIGVPVAFALAFGVYCAFVPFGTMMLVTISQNMAASLNSFTLLAIPFFILAAAVMNAGGITPRLVDLAMQLDRKSVV
jgi:TRAP-type C4-dicarboxylate transport system permease small subunit